MSIDHETKEQIKDFLLEQKAKASQRLESYLYGSANKQKNPHREHYEKLKDYIDDFLNGKKDSRTIILSGLRGAGKTTLMAQLYHEAFACHDRVDKIFLSVDHIKNIFNVRLHDVLEIYQELLESHYESLERPVFIFLDEIQYDADWDITLKTLYDRTKNVFVMATGSAALLLQSSADLARRANFEHIYPLSFKEYVEIKHNLVIDSEFSKKIQEIIFLSKSAQDVYDALVKLKPEFIGFWSKLDRFEINKYIRYGSLPFMISSENEFAIYEKTHALLQRIINIDIRNIEKFSNDVVSKVEAMLYILADSEVLSLDNIAKNVQISIPTIVDVLEALEKSETLTRVYPYGSHTKQIRKPSKYLFTASTFRSMFFNVIASTQQNSFGRLLEDSVALYLKKFLKQTFGGILSYDPNKNSADFVIGFGRDLIAIEVGSGEKDFGQVSRTLKRLEQAKYGLNISSSALALSKDKRAVNIPLEWFFLI